MVSSPSQLIFVGLEEAAFLSLPSHPCEQVFWRSVHRTARIALRTTSGPAPPVLRPLRSAGADVGVGIDLQPPTP